MNKNDKATWRQIYDDWNWAVRDFPELRSLSCCMKINITQPQYGPVYHFDWVAKGTRRGGCSGGPENPGLRIPGGWYSLEQRDD